MGPHPQPCNGVGSISVTQSRKTGIALHPAGFGEGLDAIDRGLHIGFEIILAIGDDLRLTVRHLIDDMGQARWTGAERH